MESIKIIEEKIKNNFSTVSADEIYKVANFYFSNHNLDEALKYYNLLLKVDPNHKMGLFELGSIYSNIGNLNEAINLWQKVISIDPNFTRAHFNLALAYSKMKRYSDALSELQITLLLVRQSGDPIGLEKRILQEINRIQEMQSNISYSSAANVQDLETQKQYALILLKKGELEAALQAFQEVLKVNPNEVESLFNVGVIYYKRKEFNEALEYLNKVILLKNDEAEAYFIIANIYEEMGSLDLAIENYKKAVSYNPNNYFWYYRLGKIFYSIGAYEEAIKYLRKSVELNPLDNYSHNSLGIAYLEAGNISEAIKHFMKAVYLDQNDSYGYYNLARAYVKLGQLPKAYKSIQKAIELEQKAIYFLEASKILYKMRNYKEALVFAIKANEIDSSLLDAYLLISKLYSIAKKYDEGIAILEKFSSSKNLNLLMELSNLYYIKGDLEKSISILRNIIYSNEGKQEVILEALKRIIKIYYNSSRYEDAYEYCKMMVQSYFLNKQDYILLIKIFFKLGKYEELLGVFNGLNIGEKDYELQFYYAYCNLKCGIFSVAKKYFEKLHLDFPFNTKFSYYYFYSLLRTGDYENARQLFDKIESDLFNNFKEYDDLFRNYIELLFVFKDYDLLIEKGINFLNSYDIDLSQKTKILEFIIRSLYDKKEFDKLVNIEKFLKFENMENLLEFFNDESKIIFIKSLLIKRDYLKIAYYFDNFSKFFMVDVSSENLNMDYCILYLICLFKIGRIDDAINFYRDLKEKTQKNLKIFLIIELIVNLYTKNWAESLRLVNENYRDLPNFYVIFAIRYNYLDNEKISEIHESLSDFLKDMLKVFNFDYNKIEISNLNNFMKILEDLEKYVKDPKIDEVLYLLPDNVVDFYLYSPIYLFLHLLMSNIEINMIEEKWGKVNVFRKLDLDERWLALQKIGSLIDSLKINFYGEEFYKPYILAKYSIVSGDLDRALSFLFESISHNKYFYPSRILLSLIYYLREMYDLAIEQLMEVYSEDDDVVRFLLAKNYIATKSLKLADEEFSYLLSKEEDNLKYIYYKVLTNVYMMNFKAVSLIEESYNRFKGKGRTIEFLQASLFLAHIYILIKKYKEAEDILLDLLNYFPYEEDIYKYLAIVYISTNQVPKVLNVYNLGLRNISDSSELYSQRGVLYYKAGKLDLAEKDFLRSYELNKIDFVAVSHLGLIFLRKGDLSKALNYFREAIAIKPLAYEIYANIGTVYEKMGKIIEAREYFEVAYEYNPSNVQNIKKLVEILKKMSDNMKLSLIKQEVEKNNLINPKDKEEIISLIGGL